MPSRRLKIGAAIRPQRPPPTCTERQSSEQNSKLERLRNYQRPYIIPDIRSLELPYSGGSVILKTWRGGGGGGR